MSFLKTAHDKQLLKTPNSTMSASQQEDRIDRPKTAVIGTRVDARSLAVIAKFFHDKLILPSTKSALVSMVIEGYKRIIIDNEWGEDIQYTDEALAVLRKLGFTFGEKGKRARARQMQYEGEADSILPRELGIEDDVRRAVEAMDDTPGILPTGSVCSECGQPLFIDEEGITTCKNGHTV